MYLINGLCILALAALLSLVFIDPNTLSQLSFTTPSKSNTPKLYEIKDSDLDGWSDDDEKHCQTIASDNTSTPIDSDGDGICDNLDKPIIISRPALITNGNEPYHYEIKAIDLDNTQLSYSLVNAPKDMSIEDNIISWVPLNDGRMDEEEYNFSVVVSDGHIDVIQEVKLLVNQNATYQISEGI